MLKNLNKDTHAADDLNTVWPLYATVFSLVLGSKDTSLNFCFSMSGDELGEDIS